MTLEEIIKEYGEIVCGAIVIMAIFGIIITGIKDGGMISQFLLNVLDSCAGG